MKLANFVGILFLFEACLLIDAIDKPDASNNTLPVIVITWNYTTSAAKGILIYFDINLTILCKLSDNLKIFLIIIYKRGT